MARDWQELFIVDDAGTHGTDAEATTTAPESPTEPAGEAEPRGGRFRRLRESLRRTRQALSSEIQATLFEGTLSAETWERLEEALIYADVGAGTTAKVVGQLEREATGGEISGGEELTARLTELLADIARTGEDRIDLRAKPAVILVAGVNGTGKTTTVGKLAFHIREQGHSVLLAAGDTFRAAGVEQLEKWAQRAGAGFVKGAPDADPGSVAYEAISTARREGTDVVIVDTAGRLHTQEDLMGELVKVRRVIAKQIPEAPHETLLTVDATTGQNGLRQARLFSEAVEVSGLVLTKLDGTAKGGIVLAIASELGIPVKLIGVGEQLEDLRPFDPVEYARALVT
jgi:fused signal recognition particle receptor